MLSPFAGTKGSTMIKLATLFLIFLACGRADNNSTASGNRTKRAMLFFDEDGNLMKQFASPYLQQLAQYAARRPEQENFLKYFFNFLRPLIINTSTAAYMIPVSQEVVQQMSNDPVYQNRLTISKRGPEYNALCTGRRTQIPSPNICNRFLNCWDGWAYELECPDGLMFSSEGYCDYAGAVRCHDRSVLSPEPQMPLCKEDFETFRNELNCNEFFVCVNRKPVKFKCPANLDYSSRLGVCDYPELVDCNSSPSIVSSPPQPAPIPTTASPIVEPSPTTQPPVFAQRPVPIPGHIMNLPSIPSIITGQFNKEVAFASPPLPSVPHIVPGIQEPSPDGVDDNKAPDFQFKPNVADGNAIFMQNSIYNSQNWATPVAIMSPQDAVRFLKFNNFAATDSTQQQQTL